MAEHVKSGQARRGLIDSIKGKAKEVSGAITGNDSLTAEAQLEQEQAQERKEANAIEVLADAEAREARAEEAETKVDAAAKQQSSVQATADEKLEADRLRRQADDLTNEVGLP
ncbi:hypothetical protein [Mycobacterium shigaense]|uniref:hypothetical protein n=1 Tax=Mycobacterium shigaense TaxID=722731 RepID=UPI000E586D23|nr:hypothetical protein [Mycobacterium shigaense]